MIGTLVSRTKDLVREGSSEEGDADHRDEESADDEDEAAPAFSTALYSCPECGRTYVAEEKSTCSNCRGEVEEVPDERELGLV